MFDFTKILAANPNGVLSTRDGQGIKTRVFQYQFTEGRKVYFCTSKEKDVYRQMLADPNVSFCTYPADFSPVVSVSGQAVFVDDQALKGRILNDNPMIKGIYSSPDNPVFAVFYIEAEEAVTFSFAEGKKTHRL